jgi:hypothetical protein
MFVTWNQIGAWLTRSPAFEPRRGVSHQILIFASFKRSSLMTDSTLPRLETAGDEGEES